MRYTASSGLELGIPIHWRGYVLEMAYIAAHEWRLSRRMPLFCDGPRLRSTDDRQNLAANEDSAQLDVWLQNVRIF